MRRLITLSIRALGALVIMWLWASLSTIAQTPTVNLTGYQPTTVPSGVTFEWHSDLPISASNLMNTGQVQAATPGLYYAVYNLGGTPVCYSQPTPLKVVTNTCPTATVELKASVDSTGKPVGSVVSFHTDPLATDANRVTTTAITATTTPVVYFVAYRDAAGCYTTANGAIVVVSTTCGACLAGTTAPIFTPSSLTNTCPTTTVSLASLTNAGTKPAGTTLIWSTHKVPTSAGDTLTSLTGLNTGGKFYAMYYHKASNCYSPADSVNVYITDCNSPLPPLPPPSANCDYSAPANVTLAVATEPAGYKKTYLLVDMANGKITQVNATAPSFTGVGAGNYFAVAAYYNDTLKNAAVGSKFTSVYSTSECLKYSTPLTFRVCGSCDFTTAPVTITFPAAASPTAGVTTSYVLIDEKTNQIRQISGTASFAGVDTGAYAVVAVYRSKPLNLAVGDVLYSKVTVLDSCYETSNAIHYRVCTACAAGTMAPTITATTASNTCPTTTVNLMALTNTGTKPAGTTLVWSTKRVPTLATDTLTNANAITTAGKYYALYYSKAGNCFSPADSVTVTLTACNCPAGTVAPIIATTSLTNTCPSTTVSLAGLTNTGTKPAGTTLVWSTKKVPTSPADTLTSLTGISTGGKYYAMYYHKASNCYSPADSVAVYMTDCESPLPPLPPPSPVCDYSAPANITLTTANEPAGLSKMYLLVDMANGQIVQTNATAPSFTNVGAGNYYALTAYYNGTLNNATVNKFIRNIYVSGTGNCLKYSTPLSLKVCAACDFNTVPATIAFTANPSPTAGITTTYVLIDEANNTIVQTSASASFAGVAEGSYAVAAVYSSGSPNLTVGASLYDKVTTMGSCLEVSNTLHYRVCTACAAGTTAPAITATTASNTCPTTIVNLMALTNTGTKPAGTTLVWSTKRVPTLATDTLTNANAITTAGKYYALYYSKAGNCFSPADSVVVTINVCNCPAGTVAPVFAASSLTNTCPSTTVSLAGLTNTGTKPAGTTLIWSTRKVPTSAGDTLTSLTGISTGGKYYAMYYHKASNCYSPADSVAIYITDCESPLPPLPPPSPVCDYSAPANITLMAATEPAGFLKTYLLVDMANGKIVQINATAPSFTNVGAGNYYAIAAYYKGTLEDATIGQIINNISSSEGCLKYSTPLVFRVCGSCDYTVAPATITFTAAPSPTSGVTTTYVLIDEKTNKIKAISGTASFAAIDTGYYAVVAVYRTKAVNFAVGDVLYDKVTELDSCYTTSNSIHYRVCSSLNQKPIAIDDITQTPQDTPVSGNVLPNDIDPDGGVLTVSSTPTQQPTKGTVQLNPDGSYTYTPNPGVTGTDKFCYRVCDNGNPSQCDTACVTINIIPVLSPGNDKPVATDDNTQTYQNTAVNIKVKANDFDPDVSGTPNGTLGNPTKLTDPANGTVSFNADGTVTYTPKAGFTGKDSFTYRICDNGTPALCDTATVSVEVLPTPPAGNKPPVAVDDANQTTKNTPVSGTVAANDSDPDNNTPLNFSVMGASVPGLTLNADGTYTYTPATDFVGTVTQKYKVCDSGSPVLCDTAILVITVLPPPVAKLLVKVLLQGALYGTSDGLMRDDLRSQNRIPLLEPYTALNATLGTTSTRFKHVIGGNETTTAGVLAANAGTANAVVDWVFVELRAKNDSTQVVQTVSALVQRDGDVVSATDGMSALTFTGLTNSAYFVSVKHRNHLGVMTNSAITMTTVGTLVDFTVMDSTQVWNRPTVPGLNYDGVEMNKTVLVGKKALWAGNAVMDFRLKYDGANTDLTKPLNEVLVDFSANTYNFNNGFGYKLGDINMDGKVKYAGANNDIIYIQNNVLLYRLNTGPLYNFNNMFEQIP